MSHCPPHTVRMRQNERQTNRQYSLGDRAVAIAAILAVVLVGLFGAEPDRQPQPATRTAQSAPR